MPSNKIFTAAAALLSLSGMATALVGTAPYQSINATNAAGAGAAGATGAASGPYSNGNATTSAARPSGTSVYNPDLIFCPGLNNQVSTDARGRHYVIECGISHKGIFIDIVVSKKRAAATSLNDCLLVCDEDAACVGTAFNKNTQQCSYYSQIGDRVNAPGVDFAYVTNLDGTTVAPGSGETVPSVVYTYPVHTITSCAPTVTNCPLLNAANGGAAVITETIPLYTTYCPYSGSTTTTVPASAVACTACPVSAGTATVYSGTVQQGTSTVVPVATQVVNYVNPTGSAGAVSSTGATTTVAAPSSASSVEAFTGAAGHVEAGMGMAAAMAMVVLAL